MPTTDTRETVLDVAREFVQTRGFNAFSFREVAERVGIKTASIHYYFPTKAELCRALIERQRSDVKAALAAIDSEEKDPSVKLSRYAAVFRSTLETGNRMCLCGMLAADVATLDESVVLALRESFDDHEAWLKRVLTEGKKAGVFRFAGTARNEARLLLSSLEGAMLIARTYEDQSRFEETARGLLLRLRPHPAP